ncbi:hypothetical protein E1264_42880, partial [Actinomadura sp. KC216]
RLRWLRAPSSFDRRAVGHRPPHALRGKSTSLLGPILRFHGHSRDCRDADARHRLGAAAVNLSASVTDVIALPGGDRDRRMPRIRSLGLPVHDAG